MDFSKEEFDTIVVGLVKGAQQSYRSASHDYVNHMLAAECLKQAVGPGLDARALANFVKSVETWVTLPAVGIVPLILRTGSTALADKLTGTKTPSILNEVMRNAKGLNAPDRGLIKIRPTNLPKLRVRPPKAVPVPRLKSVPMGRVFDPTGAINMGIKILADLGPLLGRLQMNQASLIALDRKAVPPARAAKVGQILEKARHPEVLKAAIKTANDELDAAWDYLCDATTEMERHRITLGLPPVAL